MRRERRKAEMFGKKVTVSLIALLMITTMTLVFPVPVMAADPPQIWVEFPNGTSFSVDEYDVTDSFTVEVWVDSNIGIWAWQVGIRFDPAILQCTGLAEGNIFDGKAALGFMAGYINNTGGYVTYGGNSLKSPETTGVDGSGILIIYDFHVISHGNCTLDLTPGWTPNPEVVPRDLVAGTKLNEKIDSTVTVIGTTLLTDGSFDNSGLKPGPYAPTAVVTQKTPEPHYVGDTIELYGGNSLQGFDGDSMRPITEYTWDIDNDGIIEQQGASATYFWDTTAATPGAHPVNLTVYAPGGPSADPTYNATMQYDDVIEIRIICSREGENHDDHLNDPTDDFPNDYAPMVITVNDKVVTVAPLITCTTLKNDTFYPHHHPCKSAQTIFVDDDWSNKDAKYTYQFEDWTDYDWNDINVSLYAVTNDIIKVEIRIEDREAAWKNPFSIEITPMDMTVEVYWNSTDYSESHNIMVYSGETADIELFAESNPCDTAFIKITPLIPPTASFVHSPSEPEEGQTVTFDASDSTSNVGIILSYNWNFGDGEIGTGKIVTHTYTLAGNYMVILNVTNSLGEWDIESKQITVKPKPQPVGGHALPININIHESNSLTFQIGLALSLPGAMAVTIILIRRRNKTLKWKH